MHRPCSLKGLYVVRLGYPLGTVRLGYSLGTVRLGYPLGTNFRGVLIFAVYMENMSPKISTHENGGVSLDYIRETKIYGSVLQCLIV